MSNTDEKDAKFLDLVKEISNWLEKSRDIADDDQIYQFSERAERVSQLLSEIREEGRLLKIGIVGCVKAGKSSFLNALIFNGDSILPKAATPMTAALTKISYSEVPRARIVFYEEYDWKNIEGLAASYDEKFQIELRNRLENQYRDGAVWETASEVLPSDIEKHLKKTLPEKIVSAHELVTMAKEKGLNVYKILREKKETVIEGNESVSGLEEFVGANGRYTPIVSHIELGINNPLLEGFEIIDTPGLNDPIVSRVRVTNNYLMHCDVVLIVSQVGQFLTKEDIDLISQKLTRENVKRAYIIGSQLDTGVLQYNRREKSLQNAFDGSIFAYNNQANDTLDRYADSEANALLQKTLPPVFVSALMFGIARKLREGKPLDKEEKAIIQNMKGRFLDFSSVLATPDDYENFAGIQEVKDRIYGEVRQEKGKILRDRADELTRTQSRMLLEILKEIERLVESNLESLRSGRDNQVKNLGLIRSKLNSVRREVGDLFVHKAVECRRGMEGIKLECAEEAKLFSDLTITEKTEYENETVHYGLLGIMSREERYEKKVKLASASEAVEQAKQYGVRVQKLLNDRLDELMKIDELREAVRSKVIAAFDTSDSDFNADEINYPLSNALNKLFVPSVSFDFLSDIEDAIFGAFPDGKAEGDKIHTLHRLLEEQKNRILRKLSEQLDAKMNEIEEQLNRYSKEFIDEIEKKISLNVEKLRKQFENREESIAKNMKFLSVTEGYKALLRSLTE